MGSVDLQGNDWDLPCSDDELSKSGVFVGKSWMPDPAELEELYENIEKNGTLNLEWKCIGRRAPSPVPVSKENQPELPMSPVREEKSDFDFMDEVSSLRLKVRRDGEDTLRGSAKKKTTSFDGILSNMIRHKRIEQMEKQANTPSTPSSNQKPELELEAEVEVTNAGAGLIKKNYKHHCLQTTFLNIIQKIPLNVERKHNCTLYANMRLTSDSDSNFSEPKSNRKCRIDWKFRLIGTEEIVSKTISKNMFVLKKTYTGYVQTDHWEI